MAIPFFELENATVYRGERIVFDRINLRLEAGTHTAVLGPNGSGKSTLVKLIFRDIYPAALPGSVMRTFGNELMNAWELRKRIGLVSADLQHRYMASVTGRSVVLSGFYSSIATGGTQEFSDEDQYAADRALERSGAVSLADRRFGTLSTGEQRRLLLARSMVHNPEILLLDEPTAGLDMNGRFAFFDLLDGFLDEGKSVLLITHHIEEIPPGIQRVILLKSGQVFADGSPSDVLKPDDLGRLFGRNIELIERGGFRYAVPESRSTPA